jgi:hypothetical protein
MGNSQQKNNHGILVEWTLWIKIKLWMKKLNWLSIKQIITQYNMSFDYFILLFN